MSAPVVLVMLSPESDATMRWVYGLLIDDAGILKTDVQIVTLLNEPPAGANNRPTRQQLADNAARFRQEMEATSPKVVIAMGPDAFRAVTGLKAKIEDARGYVLQPTLFRHVVERELQQVGVYKGKGRTHAKGDPKMKFVPIHRNPPIPAGVPVVATYSPLMVEKSGYKTIFAVKRDFSNAAAVLHGTSACGVTMYADENFTYFRSLDEPGATLDYDGPILAYDIETAGKNSRVIVRISLSNGKRTHTLPWDARTLAWVQSQFDFAARRNAILVGHNIMFDIPLLAQAGCIVPKDARWFDTMFAGHNLQPDLPKGLGRMAPVYLLLRTPWKWTEIADADPELYSAMDSYVTALLAIRMAMLMKETGFFDRFVNVIMRRLPVIMDLHREGIQVHMPTAVAWIHKLERRLARYNGLWGRTFPGINPFSTPQLAKFLFRELGLPIQRNKKGRVTTDELACVNLRQVVEAGRPKTKDDEPKPWETDARITPRVFDLLLALRFEQKELRTYAKVRADEKHRVYPQYFPDSKDQETADGSKRKGAAATGRWASHNPNLQNQSKQAKLMYIPDYPDYRFIQWDYVAAELHVLAELSGDKRLKAALAAGAIHQKNADAINCAKRTAKAVFYGSCYGAGAQKISDTIKKEDHIFVSVAECRRVQRELARLYPDAFSYLNYIGTLCVEQGFLVNPFSRVRFFYGKSRDIPAAKDYMPQSTVADIVWDTVLPMADMLRDRGGRLTTQTHDSFLGQVFGERARQVADEGVQIMEATFNVVGPGFKIPVDVEVGTNGGPWGRLIKTDLYDWEGNEDDAR